MPGLILQYPIRTLDNQSLFPAGTLVTEETLSVAIGSQRAVSYQTYPLLMYGSIQEDCLDFLGFPPYPTIFQDRKQIDGLFGLLETVRFPIPILQSLDYFKQRDLFTYTHVLMVFALSTLLAKDLIPDYQDYVQLSSTGPTHDIGKICVPLHILKKTTPLTKTERSFLEHHAAAGYVLLSYYYKDFRYLACTVALDHHERRDGSGYPRGVPLNDPLTEIIAVSDIYDALIMPRPYRSSAYDHRTALEEITEMAKQNKVGWDVVKALIAHHRKSRPSYKEITISTERRGTPPAYNVHDVLEDETDPKDKTL
ncbi:MAG TPA: HD domain-containing phosphohydrolase [Thermodesulfobacteriota bacterium]|nr:HD domain-containing phosphohydrolase [Thermodesulfobacteriota bacterium]